MATEINNLKAELEPVVKKVGEIETELEAGKRNADVSYEAELTEDDKVKAKERLQELVARLIKIERRYRTKVDNVDKLRNLSVLRNKHGRLFEKKKEEALDGVDNVFAALEMTDADEERLKGPEGYTLPEVLRPAA